MKLGIFGGMWDDSSKKYKIQAGEANLHTTYPSERESMDVCRARYQNVSW